MTTPVATRPSTRRLSEVARHVVIPSGIVTTGWPAVERRCREFGDEFDEWQRGAGRVILGKRADGSYAATVGGVVLSIPRQVAKTFLVSRIVFALCVEFPGLKVLWTAHRTRTSTNTFRSLQGYAQRKAVRPHLAQTRNDGIRTANGEQEIQFANGSVIMFGARETGFGRGFDEVDIEVFDEAQILTVRALEDMVPATNQSRHPHGALLFFMGTPPRPVDPGEVFTMKRQEALSGGADDTVYIECSADPDADPDDQGQLRKANPSFPHRTPLRSILRLRKNLPGEDSWRREGLGIWDEQAAVRTALDPDAWAACVAEPPSSGVRCFGVKFSPDGDTVALAGAVRPDDGPVHVEGVAHRRMLEGTRWLVDWLVDRRDTRVVVDGRAGAGALVRALVESGFPERRIVVPTAEQAVAAHTGLLTAVTEGTVSHIGDPALEVPVRNAVRRPIGKTGGWGLAGVNEVDVSLLEAVVLAHWGAVTAPRGRTGERRAVVL